jgi:hypothetical protein
MTLYMRFLRALGLRPRISSQVSDMRVIFAEDSNLMCITFDLKDGRRLVKIQDYQDQDGQITVLATYSKPAELTNKIISP